MHDDILKAFPELKPVVDVHLSDPDGAPMHAVANAVYHIEENDQQRLYDHLRWSDVNIDKINAVWNTKYEDLWTLLVELKRDAQLVTDKTPTEQLTIAVQNLVNAVFKPMWTEDVRKAREVLESLLEDTAVPPTPLQSAIDKYKIRMTVVREEWNPTTNQTEWIVRLRKGRKSMTTPFRAGAAHNGVTAEEVLGCCIRDAEMAENAGSFEGFCQDIGYDEDSREAERNYNACLKIGKKLQNLLGDDYDQVVTPGL
jgi:hypothetical protein